MIQTLLKGIRPDSHNSYFILPLIMRQFRKDADILRNGWHEEAFQRMESIRKIAQEYGHCFEESVILFFENMYFKESHYDKDKYTATVVRLNELHEIFDRDDDYFRRTYANIYPRKRWYTRKNIDLYIKDIYKITDFHADYFTGNLALKNAQLCGKMMQKLAAVSPENITFEQTMEALFVRAIIYGNIRDFNSAFHFYNLAIDKAKKAGDRTYLYIALQRKLSICMGLAQFDSQTDFDKERMDCVRELDRMLNEDATNAEEIGILLTMEEMKKARKASFKRKAYYRMRIGKIKEAMPMLSVLLAMARGDMETSRIYIEKLKEEERRVYGCNPGFSSADMFETMYTMMFNSPEKEESAENMEIDCQLPEDDGVIMELPDDMIPWHKFNVTLSSIRNCIILKKFESAEKHCAYLFRLADESKSDYHKAMALNAYGQAMEAQQQTEMALKAYKNAVSTLEDADPAMSDSDLSPFLYYNLLCEIGKLLKGNDPESAVSHYSKAMEWLEKQHMPQMLFMFHILNGRADAYQNMGKNDLADKDRTDFLRFAENETRRRIMLMDTDSREIFWNDTSSLIYGTVSHIRPDSEECFRIEAYNAVLLSKGMLLASEKSVKEIASGNPELKLLYDSLEKNENDRKEWGTSDSAVEYTADYLRSMKLVSEIESKIPGKDGFLHTGTEDIIQALGENDILVDCFDYETDNSDRQYVAFVLKHGCATPEIVQLCKESDLTMFFEAQMRCKDERKEVDFSVVYEPFLEESHRLEKMVWEPLAVRCGMLPENRILFVPSGSLHKVAIESLPFGDSWSHTLCDRYTVFARLTHARSMLETRHDPQKKTAAIFAAPDFGVDATDSNGMKGYSVMMSDGIQKAVPWQPLPMTKNEADELQSIFALSSGWKTYVFTGKEASVANFSNMDGRSPAILHISTHGFAETRKSAKSIPALASSHKPLDFTGIVLTEGNEGWMNGTRQNHPGILLASEIARMDLSDSEIVFVSCCFSGEGIVKPDGIYGIQRALKKAGAATIIMSLWAESEDSGKLFARNFYSSFLNGVDKRTAFRKAKQIVRENRDPRDPRFWAGFIMLD